MGTRLIALDLDGTLLNEKMHVSEKTRQVMLISGYLRVLVDTK